MRLGACPIIDGVPYPRGAERRFYSADVLPEVLNSCSNVHTRSGAKFTLKVPPLVLEITKEDCLSRPFTRTQCRGSSLTSDVKFPDVRPSTTWTSPRKLDPLSRQVSRTQSRGTAFSCDVKFPVMHASNPMPRNPSARPLTSSPTGTISWSTSQPLPPPVASEPLPRPTATWAGPWTSKSVLSKPVADEAGASSQSASPMHLPRAKTLPQSPSAPRLDGAQSPRLSVDELLHPSVGVSSLRRSQSIGDVGSLSPSSRFPKPMTCLLDEVHPRRRRLSSTAHRVFAQQRLIRKFSLCSVGSDMNM